jgi:glutathione S-transferase
MRPEGLTLISGLPSPYARKVRIYLHEKSLPFTLQTEVPWDSTTTLPMHNPLEKLPVLILPNGCSIYESHLILEYLELKYPDSSPMLPSLEDVNGLEERLFAKKIEVIADGVCDALVLVFFEKQRGDCRSKEWEERQMRKVDGGVKALAEFLPREKSDEKERFMVCDRFGLADVATGCVLGYLDLRFPEYVNL